jgi:NAD+ diphosphatase
LSPGAIDQLRLETPPVFLGLRAAVPHFTVDISHCEAPLEALGLNSDWQFEDCRAAAMRLDGAEAGILAQCRSQIDWHRRHMFCGVCGSQTQQARGGHVRICGQCSAQHFPRTDPVVIMVIADGERCLLGQSRGRLAQSKMYSALAGFIDQGESIEEAVRREVGEEAGIEVGDVRYHSSQPWPFPSSLMVGCHGVAASTDIAIDTNEMTDVSWFSRDEVLAALRETNPNLRVPGAIAIAHHLIKAWAHREVEL